MSKANEIILNYLKGQSSAYEQAFLLDFLRKSPANKAYFDTIKFEWQSGNLKTYTKEEWEAWHNTKTKILNQSRRCAYSAAIMIFYRIASVIAIVAIVSIFIFIPVLQKQWVIVKTNPGQTIDLTLPDSTSVILNSSSSLEYHPLAFMFSRRIKMEGEAFFNVQKSGLSAFRVISNGMKVKVTGTMFNVNSYPEYSRFRVVLVEGSVQAMGKPYIKNAVNLIPGEMLNVDKETSQVKVCKVNTRLHTSWKEGMLYFYDSKFEEVVERIETRYGIQIDITEDIINTFLISTTIRDEPLENILDLFKKVLPIKIEENNSVFLIRLDNERYEKRLKNT